MSEPALTVRVSRAQLSTALLVSGSVAVAAALVTYWLGIGASSSFGWKKATLLIVGCDLLIASLITRPHRAEATEEVTADGVALLATAIADGVLLFGINAAAVIVLFGQSKPIERLGYFSSILVVVPLTVTLVWRRSRMARQPAQERLVAFLILLTTAAVLCLARILGLSRSATLDTSLFVVVALVVTRMAIALLSPHLRRSRLQRVAASALIAATPLALAAAAAPFVPPGMGSIVNLAIALAAALVTFGLVGALAHSERLSSTWVRVLDAGVVIACLLVVLSDAAPALPGHTNIIYQGLPAVVLDGNQNYFLGPATDILHGHAMLVSTFSQYGFGLMDALAAVFAIVPLGYGTFTLLLSVSTALLFVVVYTVLRWSTGSLFMAAVGLAVAIVLGTFGTLGYYTWAPSIGVLRFGLPWLVILFSLASARSARHKRRFDALVLATVAIASVWSGEACVYCLGTAVALALLDASVADADWRERLRKATRRTVQLVATSLSALLVFTLLTKVLAGAWPNWSAYLYYVRLYTTIGLGDLPIDAWSPGLALGATYVVSAIVIVVIVITWPDVVRERVAAFRAAVGLTVFGMLVYTYFLGRAHPNNLYHISPPGVALVFVWVGIARLTVPNRTPVAIASGAVVFMGALIIANEGNTLKEKYPTTALASILGDAPSPGRELSTLWNNPVVDPESGHVAAFVRSLPGRRSGLTLLLTPNVETEALLRLSAANAVGSSQPCQESLSTEGTGRVAKQVSALRAGGVVVTSSVPNDAGFLPPIEQYTLALLRSRFLLRQIGSDGRGLQAFQMVRLATASPPPAVPPIPLGSVGCA